MAFPPVILQFIPMPFFRDRFQYAFLKSSTNEIHKVLFVANGAIRADKIIWQIRKLHTGGIALVGIPLCFIIGIATTRALVTTHFGTPHSFAQAATASGG
jgi:hypothetical protein